MTYVTLNLINGGTVVIPDIATPAVLTLTATTCRVCWEGQTFDCLGAAATVAANFTGYVSRTLLTAGNVSGVPIGSVRYLAFGVGGSFTSVPWGCPMPTGTAKTLRVLPSANSLTTASTRVTLLKAGVATALMVTIPPMSTTLASDTDSISFASGDRTSVQIDTDAGGAGSINVVLSVSFEILSP